MNTDPSLDPSIDDLSIDSTIDPGSTVPARPGIRIPSMEDSQAAARIHEMTRAQLLQALADTDAAIQRFRAQVFDLDVDGDDLEDLIDGVEREQDRVLSRVLEILDLQLAGTSRPVTGPGPAQPGQPGQPDQPGRDRSGRDGSVPVVGGGWV